MVAEKEETRNCLIITYAYHSPSAANVLLSVSFSGESSVPGSVNYRMNPATSLFRRLNIRDLVTGTPTYSAASDVSGNGLGLMFKRWATKKTAGSTKNGRDSKPKNLGVKKFGGERVIPGNIIVRQRGTRFHPGNYVGIGKDHTLYALKEGCVKFEHHKLSGRKWVHVEPKDGHVLHPVYSSAAAPELKIAT
ncbi:hypothetical protein K7X08_025375 [Anisodus acutangulus]|uniref:Ribosomal protein L27 n=2 Tax=Anisodus TaxID=243963 RepID=A0A9Q1LX26_9SOLA|nr:hypothetical protein K7X08_025375 [Anisodus acutangulus]